MTANTTIVDIVCAADRSPAISLDWLRNHVLLASGLLPQAVERIGILIADDARMSALHSAHCGIDGPTDVLTFPLSAPGEPIIADLALGVDEAARRAHQYGHSIERELLLYAVHGLLHCAGFDDHDAADFSHMHAEEDRILAAIGVGATFAAPRPTDAPDGGSAS